MIFQTYIRNEGHIYTCKNESIIKSFGKLNQKMEFCLKQMNVENPWLKNTYKPDIYSIYHLDV